MKHLGTQELTTDRLILRKLTVDDAKSMFDNWASSIFSGRYINWPVLNDMESVKELLTNIDDKYKSNNHYDWGIVLKETNELIGNIRVVDYSEKNESAEICFITGLNWWSNGYTTEASKAVIKFLFEEVGLHRVYAMHDVRNPASARVMEKSGMLYEGTFREAKKDRDEGVYVALCQYGIVKSDNKDK